MGRRVIGMGTLRFPRARSHHQDRPFASPTIPRSRAMDQIRKPVAPTDRGLRDEGFRVRGRVGPALRRVRTAPIRRRILGPAGRGELDVRVMEESYSMSFGVRVRLLARA